MIVLRELQEKDALKIFRLIMIDAIRFISESNLILNKAFIDINLSWYGILQNEYKEEQNKS